MKLAEWYIELLDKANSEEEKELFEQIVRAMLCIRKHRFIAGKEKP